MVHRTAAALLPATDMVLAGMQRFPPPLLAQAVASCGRLGARCERAGTAQGAVPAAAQACWHPAAAMRLPQAATRPPPTSPARSEEMLLDEVGRHVMRHVDRLAAADIAQLAGGLAALDHSPGVVLFDAMAARAAAIAADFTPEQRQQVAAAYAALGYGRKAPRFS